MRCYNNAVNLHLNLSTSLPEHIIAKATLMENTRILPELSLEYADISQFNKSPAFESTGTYKEHAKHLN